MNIITSIQCTCLYRSLSIAKFNAIAPDNDLSSQVGVAARACKVLQRIRIPDPAIVHQCQGPCRMHLGTIILRQSCEIGLDQRITTSEGGEKLNIAIRTPRQTRISNACYHERDVLISYSSVIGPSLGPCSSRRMYFTRLSTFLMMVSTSLS